MALTMMVGAQSAGADEVTITDVVENTKAPFGFATRSSRTDSGASYDITGGGAYTVADINALIEAGGSFTNTQMIVGGKKIIVLTSEGTAMDATILSAITNNDIIVFDGSGTSKDFLIDEQIALRALSNKTLIGLNGARLCTTWHITDVIKSWLNAVETSSGSGVSNASTAAGTGGSFYLKNVAGEDSLLVTIDEEGEFLTRKTLADKGSELYQKWLQDKEADPSLPMPENAYFLRTERYKKSGVFYIDGCSNFIIRNLSFVGPGSVDVGGVDLVSVINSTHHVWVDHCEFIDGQDGNFDITNESDYITASWCHFHYTDRSYVHQNTNLIGSSDSKVEDRGKLNTTFAYNEWGENSRSRMPMARFGKIHLLNNWYNCSGNTEYAVNPRLESEFLVEGNYFDQGVAKTFRNQNATAVTVVDNTVVDLSATTLTGSGETVTVPYNYQAIPSAKIPDMIDLLVGPKLDLMPTYTENPNNSEDPESPLYSLETTTTKAAQGLIFSVWAENTISYQWYKATQADLSDAEAIDGATRNSYTFKSGEESTSYLYCVATGLAGLAQSNTIMITISGTGEPIFVDPKLKSYKNYTYEAAKGVPYTLTVEAGDKPSYQWYHYSSASPTGVAIPGATGKSYTYTTPSGDAADVRDFFYCVATNTEADKEFTTVSDTACVKYVAMQTPINFVATSVEAGTTGGGDMTGITIHESSTASKETRAGLGTLKLNNGPETPTPPSTNPRGFRLDVGGFQVGDVITFAGFIDTSDGTRSAQARLVKIVVDEESAPTSWSDIYDPGVCFVNKNGDASAVPVEYSYTLKAGDLDNTDGYIYVARSGNTSVWLTEIKVTRGDPDEPNQPYITTDINETYETTEGTAVDITMVAEDAASYAWYTVSGTDSYETGKTVITGETSATCSFKKDEAGTYYVYGVAISGTGAVHKYANTRIATVTVEAAPDTDTETLINFVADLEEPDEEDLKGITLSESGAVVASNNNGYKTNTQALKALQLTTTDGYIELSVAGGFKAGDVITIAGYYSNNAAKTTSAKLMKSDGTTLLFQTENFINGRLSDDDATSGTYTLTEDLSTLLIYRGGSTSTNISQITVTREVDAPVYVEKAIYTTNFQDWATISVGDKAATDATNTHNARTTAKDDFTFTIFNTSVSPSDSQLNANGASVGALKAAKEDTDARNAYVSTTTLPSITKVHYIHGATGTNRGWGLKVKGTQENGTVDADWVTVYSTVADTQRGTVVEVDDINRTNCQLMFYNLSKGNYAYMSDLVIYGMVQLTSCDEPTAVKGAWQEESEKWRYTISTTTDDAYLHYTIDGGAEQIYEGASTTIDLTPGAQLVVWAVDPTGSVDASAEVAVTIAAVPTASTPTITIGTLTMASATFSVTMASADGGTIHYTTDGTEPTEASATYSAAIDVAPSTTIKAIVAKAHYTNSAVASATTLAFTHPTGDEAIVMDNGASGDNVGVSYKVDGTYNAGTYSGNSGTGIKYVTNRAVGPTGSDKGFRIKVNEGFVIKKLVFTNFSSNYATTETFNHVYVDGSTTDIRDVNGEEYTDVIPPFYNATSGDKSMEWTLDNLNAKDSIVFHVTPGGNQARALVQVYYEVDDSPVSVSINGGTPIAVNGENFPENIYDDATVYDEVPTIKMTTSKGFVYDLAYEGSDGDKSVYSYTILGTIYKVKMKVKAVAAPMITIGEEMSLVAGGKAGYKVELTDIKDEEGIVPYIIIDPTDPENPDYVDGEIYDPSKDYYALKNVAAYCEYIDEGTPAKTAIRVAACPDNDYDPAKPFAVFIYQTGYADTGAGQEDATGSSSYDATKDQVHLGLADQYNVIDFTFASAQSDKSITEIKPDITNAKLVVISEMVGGSGQWIDATGLNTGCTHMAMSFRDELIGATNVLNMKMFFYSQSKNNTSRWAWAQPATLSNSVIGIKPTNAMYKVFENVSFSRDGSVALFNNTDEESTLNHLQLVHNYNESNESLPEFIALATATDIADGEVYDALHFFEKNGYTYVATGISINDYLHYDENLCNLVSTIGKMINDGESLGTKLTDLPAPRIRDNGDGSATITNNNVAATTYYRTSANADETWTADEIKAEGLVATDFMTRKFNSDVYVYAVTDVNGTLSAVAIEEVKGTTVRYVHRTTDDAAAEGLSASKPFTAEAGTIKIPYNQSFSKPGYTVTKWVDKYTGTEYTPGADYATTAESQDLNLVAVWTANTKNITDAVNNETEEQRTVTWNFLQSDGAPALALEYGSSTLAKQGLIVGQMHFNDGTFIDVAMKINVDNTTTLPDKSDEYTGKFNNKANSFTDPEKYVTEFTQVRNGTQFIFPSVYGMQVKYKQATFEKYDGSETVREKSVTYVTQSTLTDGTLTNPGLVTNEAGAVTVDGNGVATVLNGDNIATGGVFSYVGIDSLATLTSRESAYYIAPESPATSSKTVGSLNYGTAFMHSLSVVYPALYDFTKEVNFPEGHVYILPNYETMTEDSIKARAAKVTLSETKKNCKGRYVAGTTVDISVVPGYGFYFEEGNPGDVTTSGLDGTMTIEQKKAYGSFTVTGAPVLTINLRQNTVYPYDVSRTPLNAGSVRITSNTGKDEADEYLAFPKDSTINITPIAKVGYQFDRWTNGDGMEYITFPDGVTKNANGSLTVVVNETNAAAKYVAVFKPSLSGTTYYEVPNAGRFISLTEFADFDEIWPSYIEGRTAADSTKVFEYYHFPKSRTSTALYIPTNYTLYKPGYTLRNWVYIKDFDPANPSTLYPEEDIQEYFIGSYYYFDKEGETRHILPIFKENDPSGDNDEKVFDYRTTTADITWDFRTAYFAQHLNFPEKTEFDYATHATINGDLEVDVPLHIKGVADNTMLDEWCHFDEGTVITIPSGLGARFTLVTYHKLSSTTIDGEVPLEYTMRTENDIPVYYYTYTTQNPATTIDLVVGKDHTYYKSIRAQLPSADKVKLTTKSNNVVFGGIEVVKANTTEAKIADANEPSDVAYTTETSDDGTVYTMPLGSYVKIKATRNRLYELKNFVIDGVTIPANVEEAAAMGYTITVPTGTDKEYTLIFRLYSYDTKVEAVYGDRMKYQVTYSSGGQAYGEAPGVRVVEDGETFTMPAKNQTLYLEGYTLKYWQDESGIIAIDENGVSTGENKYEWGKTYTPTQDMYLTPVFEINDFTLFDIPSTGGPYIVEWPLTTGSDPIYGGAPLLKYQKSSGVYVSQLHVGEHFIDLNLNIDCTVSTAKVDNSATDYRCQVNTGSIMMVPTNSNTKLTIYTVNGELSSTKIAGSTSEKAGSGATRYTPQLEPGTTRDYYATVTYTGDESAQEIDFAGDAGYFKMVRAEYGKVDNTNLPALDYVTVNNIALGAYGTSYENYSLFDLVENKTITIPITLSTDALTMPKVKAEANQQEAIVTVSQATVDEPTATIIVKTSTGSTVGIYKVVFDPTYTSVEEPALQKIEMNGILVMAHDLSGMVNYIDGTDTKMNVSGAINITFNHDMNAAEVDESNTGLGQALTANMGKTLTFRYWNLDVNATYTFTIPANELSDVYGKPFAEPITFQFNTAATSQTIVKRNVNFVVTHKQAYTFNSADPTKNYTTGVKRQVASDDLIANLDAAGIAHGTIDEGIALAGTGTERYYIFVPDGEYQIRGNSATAAITAANSAGDAPADNDGNLRDDLIGKQIYNGMTTINRENLSITGQSEKGTKIFNKPEIEGISYTSTFFVNGVTGFYVQDMTLTNAFDYKTSMGRQPSGAGARAVVLRDRGNKTIMKNVTMDSWQDTYYSNLSNKYNDSRGYFEDCTIKGYVDFICGDGDQWFQNCKLILRNGKEGNAANMIAPSTDPVQKWGYVFKNCEVLAEDDATYNTCNGRFTLGRPWKFSPAMSLIDTKFNVLSSEDGYKQMSNSGLVLRMHEYGSVDANDALLDLSTRSLRASSPGAGSYSAVMTPAEAAEYTIHNALGGTDGYDPTLYTKQISMEDAELTSVDRSLSWNEQSEALCYFIFRKNASDGYDLFAVTADTSYELDDSQIGKVFIVRAANQRGGLGEPSNEFTYEVHESFKLTLTEAQQAEVDNVMWSWSTIYLDYNAKAPTVADGNPEADAYVYAVVNVTPISMTLKRVSILEKNQGYVVKGKPGTYTFAYTDSEGEYFTGDLSDAAYSDYTAVKAGRMSILDGTVETVSRAGKEVYTLFYKENYGLGFYTYTGAYLNANKAYLDGSYVGTEGAGGIAIETQSGNSGLIFLDDLTPTDIQKLRNTADDADERIYTVYGQRVKRSEMIKGRVYIVNGRKLAY